jgi:hypothetical protein
MLMADLIAAATAPVPLIRPEEFRKNAAKSGWELWTEVQAQVPSNSNVGGTGGGD